MSAFKSCPICWERDCNHSYADLQAWIKECDAKKEKEDLEFSKRVFPPYIMNSEEISINVGMFKEIDSSSEPKLDYIEPDYPFKSEFELLFEYYLDEFDALSPESIEDIIAVIHEVYSIGKRTRFVKYSILTEEQDKFIFEEGMERRMYNDRIEKRQQIITKLRERKNENISC